MVKTFASTLMKCLQEQDIAARMGGGEFAVLLSNSAEHDVASLLPSTSLIDFRLSMLK